MIVVLKPNLPPEEIEKVIAEVTKLGYEPRPIYGKIQTVVAAIGDENIHQSLETLSSWPQVEHVHRVQKRYKLVSREAKKGQDTILKIHGQEIGAGKKFCFMAGPCSVESEEQLMTTAKVVRAHGATFLRGGAFKPRTSPYEFQGLAEEGLKLLAQASKEYGLGIVTEVLSERDVELVARYADILQIGARNSQNFSLIVEAARSGKPILLKRGLSMKIEEWLLAAEYILANGNPNVLLCERGIRTFETYTRNTLDLAAAAIVKKESHLPVIIDPSQGCGRADLVLELCKAAAALNADGLLIEVHPNPAEAWSDGQQQVDFSLYEELVQALKPFITAAGRPL
ncbi:MAG TPA: 3-deoxy-7-phosphoheptulonate synthase [Candidatus Methylacidiphilales bacterium]|nr:3-deoxy-7-phosphoheptulonate synthase [Candidatus Methylacidiphilales bacterium]